MPTKKATKKVVAKKPKPKYTLTVRMNDEVFSCSTDDVLTALTALNPVKIKTRVVVRVANALSSVERIMAVRQAKWLFRNSLTMKTFVANALKALKND